MSAPALLELPKLPDDFRSANDCLADCLVRADKYREIRDLPESKRPDTWETDRRKAAQDVLEANTVFDLAVKAEQRVRDVQAINDAIVIETERARLGLRGPDAAFLPTSDEARSAGQQFVDATKDRGHRSGNDEIEVRNLLTGAVAAPGSGYFVPVGSPQLYVPPRRRRLFVRDLIGVQGTGLASIPYIRELNPATNETGATAVAEASAKPEVTMEFEKDDAPVRKLAAWLQITEEALEDAATLRGYIDGRLAYMLMVREEAQVIGVGAGGGNAPNLKGILDFSGVQTNSGEFYDGVGTSIGKIENVDGDPDGVVANPVDYWAAVTDRHSTFYDGNAFGSGAAAPFGAPQLTAWGLPVVRSRSVASGTALVGDFGGGATLFERQGPTIRTTDSHASLFISNTWVILAEERIALAVHRADWFVKLTVSAPT